MNEKEEQLLQLLQGCKLFSTAAEATKRKAISSPLSRVEVFLPGDLICDGERSLQAAGVVLSGCVRVTGSGNTDDVLLNRLQSGRVFGFAGLFSDRQSYTYVTTILAERRTEILWLPEALLRELLESDPAFSIGVISLLSEKVRFLNSKIRAFTADSAGNKLLLYLEKNADEDGNICLSCSMSELSRRLNIGRASLYRAVETLESTGRLTRVGKRFYLHQPSVDQDRC